MYTKEQEERALQEIERLGSITAVIQKLGYPSSSTLYRWDERKRAGIENRHQNSRKDQAFWKENTSANASAEFKYNVIRHCFEDGEAVEYVSREIGYSRVSIYKWRRQYLQQGMIGLMAGKRRLEKQPIPQVEPGSSKSGIEEIEDLREKVRNLQMEVDVLKETIQVLKKDPGVDMKELRNREKAVIIGALKDKYALPRLLQFLGMAKSSYYYQRAAINRPDRHSGLHARVTEIFNENRCVYGYRRIHIALCREGVHVSEKVVRRIMRNENLEVLSPKQKKYSSYRGEITPAAENLIARDFHANKPDEKWLTDITEFALPCGKFYLSSIIDCFDGMVVSWTAGSRPNADLVNSMLDQALANLPVGHRPIVHSDRGCHYRWPGWICRLEHAGLMRSMSRKGCSPDNAACEGFFGRLKNEMFYSRSWMNFSGEEFIHELSEYIQWYNSKRIKCSLGGRSPLEYRQSLGIA